MLKPWSNSIQSKLAETLIVLALVQSYQLEHLQVKQWAHNSIKLVS